MTDELFTNEAYQHIQIGGVTRQRTITDHYLVLDKVEFDLDELIAVLVTPDDYILTDVAQAEVLKLYGVIEHPGHARMCASLTVGPNASSFLSKIRALRDDLRGASK